MRIHWKGLNTAEKKSELEDTASQDVQSETHRGKNFPSMKSVQRATEQTSAQRRERESRETLEEAMALKCPSLTKAVSLQKQDAR